MTKRIKDVSDQLSVSSQTIRNYLKLGPEFFSERATHPTRKRFDDDDIRQLLTIKQLLEDGHTYDQIPDQLSQAARIIDINYDVDQVQPPEDTETETPPEDTPPPPTDLAIQYEPIIAAQQQTIQTLNDHINTLKSDKDRLQSENDRLREDLDHSKRPWWSRLFGNSPE